MYTGVSAGDSYKYGEAKWLWQNSCACVLVVLIAVLTTAAAIVDYCPHGFLGIFQRAVHALECFFDMQDSDKYLVVSWRCTLLGIVSAALTLC